MRYSKRKKPSYPFMLWATPLKCSCWSVNNHSPNFSAISAASNVTSRNPHLPGKGPLSSLSHKPVLSQSSQQVPHFLHTESGVRGLSMQWGQTE